MISIDSLFDFFKFTHALHNTERVARIPGTVRYANVIEHTCQLALVAWYIIDSCDLKLDKELVLKYALAHDSVEAYAGDTYFYDTEALETKEKREQEARERMKKEFPDFKELHKLLVAYEERADAESKFVYALDKIMDPINIYLENGLLWREKDVTLPMLLAKKEDKVRCDDTVAAIFSDLKKKLIEREKELFEKT